MASTTNSNGRRTKEVLKSIMSAAPKLKLNEVEIEGAEIVHSSKHVSEYYANKKNIDTSLSHDGEDEKFKDGVLKANDRRTSWQQVRSQKSFNPSLSAICKYKFLFFSIYYICKLVFSFLIHHSRYSR